MQHPLTQLNNLRWSLFEPGDRVLVAVSGGPDSLSLLYALWTEGATRGLGGVEAAHLDHGLRGDESAEEARWVANWCAERGIACHVGWADVRALASARKLSTQEAARHTRYAFLDKIAAEIGADVIATGHTRDDQVETVLGNILRGTGVDGLRGIAERRDNYVRPLLDVSRVEIEAYCAAHGVTPRRDPSNLATDHYTRNRIRLELLPRLRHDFNPNVDATLLRLSEIAARDSDYLTMQASAALADVTRTSDIFRQRLDRAALAALHPALLRNVLRQAIANLRGTAEGITYEHLERVCHAVRGESDRAFVLTLPHPLCTMRVSVQTLTLTLANVPPDLGYRSVSLSVPGEAVLDEIGWRVIAEFAGKPPRPNSGEPEREEKPSETTPVPPELGARRPFLDAWFDAEAVNIPSLTLRNWQQGDKIDPLGLGGRHKKVSDIFTDAKVPRSERHRIPMVADASGILWIVGHTIAERAKLTPSTSRRLYLRAIPPSPTPIKPSIMGEQYRIHPVQSGSPIIGG